MCIGKGERQSFSWSGVCVLGRGEIIIYSRSGVCVCVCRGEGGGSYSWVVCV